MTRRLRRQAGAAFVPRAWEHVGAHLRVHPCFDQGIQGRVDHRRRAAGIHMQARQVGEILAHRLVQQAATPLPATGVADHPVQEQVRQAFPLRPVRQSVEILRTPNAPVEMYRMGEAGGAAVLDQAVHLRHAGSAAISTSGPSGSSARCASPNGSWIRARRSRCNCDQRDGTVFLARMCNSRSRPACGAEARKRRAVAAVTLQQQVLPGVIAWRLAGRRAQADPVDVAADLFAEAQLAGQLAQRQFTRRQHPSQCSTQSSSGSARQVKSSP